MLRLLDGLLELIAPARCAGCDLPGEVLCPACRDRAERFDRSESCPRCGAPYGGLVCTECWERGYSFEAALALGELARPLSRAVVLHKDGGERRLGDALGVMLGEAVAEQWRSWPDAVTWVPPTPAALARRGFDHGCALAEPVARVLGVQAVALLARGQARDQRALGRVDRAANAAETFSAIGPSPARVLVIDDVLTTGATLDTASDVLLAAGAEAVRVAVVARAW